jgi:hypothetical protein
VIVTGTPGTGAPVASVTDPPSARVLPNPTRNRGTTGVVRFDPAREVAPATGVLPATVRDTAVPTLTPVGPAVWMVAPARVR